MQPQAISHPAQATSHGGCGSILQRPSRRPNESLPAISPTLLRLFTGYARRYLRRHFNSLRVSRQGLPVTSFAGPMVVYSNHASWWDPLVGLLVTQALLPEKRVFAPMEAAAFARYRFFAKLGVFGVEAGSLAGASAFHRTAAAILTESQSLLWLTPQARFADVRERPVQLKPGLGHLPSLGGRICFVPVAIEYVFWEERLPEILVRLGPALETSPADRSIQPREWLVYFSRQLEETQTALAAESLRRGPRDFHCLLRGATGVGGVYDWWRQWRARMRGETFDPQHGQL